MRPFARVMLLLVALSPEALFAQSSAPALDFSGTMFGNFGIRTDSASRAATGGKNPNRFDLERIYLTFRMPSGDKTLIRVTTDVFQNATGGYYSGWTVRVKYGYLQREISKSLFGVQGLTAVGRVGMLHNVIVETVEQYWPRWLGTVGAERNGFFSSADLGASSLITLPNKRGEVYVTVLNGPGYTAPENDRFKDVAGRITLTPFANRAGPVKGLTITPWYSKGASASAFFNGGAGQVGPVTDGVQKDRRGVVLGLKDRRLTALADIGQRVEEIEGGANTAVSPRTVTRRTSNLTSFFGMARPLEWLHNDKQSPFGVVARLDNFRIDRTMDPGTKFSFVGAFWDASAKSTFTLEYQSLTPTGGGATMAVKMIALHWKADF